jgi:hypothetical protein
MPKTGAVEFAQCPYDASPIDGETYLGDSTLFSCSTCGAVWKCQTTWLWRVRAPDRDAVRSARAGPEPALESNAPDPASFEATWRRVRSSIISISGDSKRARRPRTDR